MDLGYCNIVAHPHIYSLIFKGCGSPCPIETSANDLLKGIQIGDMQHFVTSGTRTVTCCDHENA